MWEALLPLFSKVLEVVLPDPKAAADAKLKMLELAQNGELAKLTAETDLVKGQLEVNKTEAANPSIFVSGWRPFVGWVCGSGLAIQFLVAPICTWISALAGHPLTFPSLDMGTLITLLGGLLGLGSMRTYEKINGVNSGH